MALDVENSNSSDDEEYKSSSTEEEDYDIIINQKRYTNRLPNKVSQIYLKTGVEGALVQITLPHTMPNQHWRII